MPVQRPKRRRLRNLAVAGALAATAVGAVGHVANTRATPGTHSAARRPSTEQNKHTAKLRAEARKRSEQAKVTYKKEVFDSLPKPIRTLPGVQRLSIAELERLKGMEDEVRRSVMAKKQPRSQRQMDGEERRAWHRAFLKLKASSRKKG